MKASKLEFRRWIPKAKIISSVNVDDGNFYGYTREAFCDERYVFEEVSHVDGDTTAFSTAYQ